MKAGVEHGGRHAATGGHPGRAVLTAEQRGLLLDVTQLGLDGGGIVDPTGALDAARGVISLGRGDVWGAGISGVGILLPVIGDLVEGRQAR